MPRHEMMMSPISLQEEFELRLRGIGDLRKEQFEIVPVYLEEDLVLLEYEEREPLEVPPEDLADEMVLLAHERVEERTLRRHLCRIVSKAPFRAAKFPVRRTKWFRRMAG